MINMLLLSCTVCSEAVGTFNEFQKSTFRWCERREWMQIDPAPLMDALVYSGYAIGTSLATTTKYFNKLNKPK